MKKGQPGNHFPTALCLCKNLVSLLCELTMALIPSLDKGT